MATKPENKQGDPLFLFDFKDVLVLININFGKFSKSFDYFFFFSGITLISFCFLMTKTVWKPFS